LRGKEDKMVRNKRLYVLFFIPFTAMVNLPGSNVTHVERQLIAGVEISGIFRGGFATPDFTSIVVFTEIGKAVFDSAITVVG